MRMLEYILPRHLQIIYEINSRHLEAREGREREGGGRGREREGEGGRGREREGEGEGGRGRERGGEGKWTLISCVLGVQRWCVCVRERE